MSNRIPGLRIPERKPGEPSLLPPVTLQGVGPFYDVPELGH